MGKLKVNVNKNYEIWNDVSIWENDGEEWSTHFETTDKLWEEVIQPRVSSYIKGNVLEIAPGRGRMTRKLLESNIDLEILDLSDTCIARCKERYGERISGYHVGNGKDLRSIEDESKDFVFSFDSFVHMHEEVIDSYIEEVSRVLKSGGYCWIHHANISEGNDDNFKNIAGRSNMTITTFKNIAEDYGFEIVKQDLIKWEADGNPEWLRDGLSLIKKL